MIRTHEKTKEDIHSDGLNKELCPRCVVTSDRRTGLSGQCEVRHIQSEFGQVGSNTSLNSTRWIPSTVLLSHITAKAHKAYRITGYPQTWILLHVSARNRHPQRDLLRQFYITAWYIYIYIYIYLYTGCNRRNKPDFGRVFLMLNYTEKPQNTYTQSWTVWEIMASEVWNFDSCYTLTDYQIRIEPGRNMWFL